MNAMDKLRIHYFQHVPFEGIGYMEEWALANGHQLSSTRFYAGEALPRIESIDWLIMMGGPMDIYQEDNYPWLGEEKKFIKQAVDCGKMVLGFCLGAQLIAHVMGAKVSCGLEKEVGWHPLYFTEEVTHVEAFRGIADFPSVVFHWHQDMFGIPQGARRIAYSNGCSNQAFAIDNNVLAFQFHLETTADSMRGMINHCPDDCNGQGMYVQTDDEILQGEKYIADNNRFLKQLLDNLAELKR